MKKGKHVEKTKTIEIYILLLFIATLFISIGYANIVDQEMKVTGTTIAYAQEGVYITDVEYVTDTNADTTNSNINYFLGTMMESKVVLGNSSSTITYKVTIYNSTDKEQIFIGVLTDKTDELQYSNTNIGYSVASAGNITGLEQYVTTIAPGETLTFPVTFSYEGTDTSNNTLVSKINFRFKAEPILELSNEGETYTLEEIYAGYTPAEYEFTVTNYNETKTNTVPMTYTIETTINSPLQAKIYDENGNEVTGSISIGGETQEINNYTLKIIWEESLIYNAKTALCTVKIKAKPTEEKYLDYEIIKEFNIDISTICIHNWKNGVCTKCGEREPLPEGAGKMVIANTEYIDDNGDIAMIPAGFTISGVWDEVTIDEGLVIYQIPEGVTVDWTDETAVATAQQIYDQFVWIPVNDINDMYMCQSEDGTKSCNITVKEIEGEEVAYCTTHNSTQMAGRLYITGYNVPFNAEATNQTYRAGHGLREPDTVSESDGVDENLEILSEMLEPNATTKEYNSIENFKAKLQEEYNEVVKSVYLNEGFYVGRYETSNLSKTYGKAVKVVKDTTNATCNKNWYYMYAQQVKYAENKGLSVGSTMIQGAAYDQVMKFVNTEDYDVTTSGKVRHDFDALYETGSQSADQSKNIYDLEGRLFTWTTEVMYIDCRCYRGGSWLSTRSACEESRNYSYCAGRYVRFVTFALCKIILDNFTSSSYRVELLVLLYNLHL